MKLKYLLFKIVFILLIIACLAICTFVNLGPRQSGVQASPTVIINEFRGTAAEPS